MTNSEPTRNPRNQSNYGFLRYTVVSIYPQSVQAETQLRCSRCNRYFKQSFTDGKANIHWTGSISCLGSVCLNLLHNSTGLIDFSSPEWLSDCNYCNSLGLQNEEKVWHVAHTCLQEQYFKVLWIKRGQILIWWLLQNIAKCASAVIFCEAFCEEFDYITRPC